MLAQRTTLICSNEAKDAELIDPVLEATSGEFSADFYNEDNGVVMLDLTSVCATLTYEQARDLRELLNQPDVGRLLGV